MILALSSLSTQGVWVLSDERAQTLIDSEVWQDNESSGLSIEIGRRFDTLLARNHLQPKDITKVFGVSGPGAFTGLRMGAAFLQGLARALGITLKKIPTYDLHGEPFYIPLRHHKVASLDLPEAQKSQMEFYALKSAQDFSIAVPDIHSTVWGLKDKALWPSAIELFRALRHNIDSIEKFEIVYGSAPKISVPKSQVAAK